MSRAEAIQLAYLLAAVLFIFGLKGLAHPRTAVRGNLLGALGMLVAIVAVLVDQRIVSYGAIALGMAIGSVIGALLATRVRMTGMPQMVALLNGLGGAASGLVATVEYSVAAPLLVGQPVDLHAPTTIATGAAALIGGVTLTGSFIAWAKLEERLGARLPGARVVNGLLVATCLALVVALVVAPSMTTFWMLVGVAAVLGVTLVLPIGGADMPVVIALLNSYSGLAGAAAGFLLGNTALIIAGSLVGASGIFLTAIMCRAMNRSLANVLFGGMGTTVASGDKDFYAGRVRSTSTEELAMLLEGAGRVVFVPGYGMAVAQAQHAVRDVMLALEKAGTEVEFAIHPVAGRMPGHMNVLLAESDVPYDRMKEMDAINPTFGQVDVVIVIGANDVVNPSARTDPSSPIAGMPILDVDKARTVVVVKRSLSPGFAGVPNPLFVADNTLLLFADAKEAMSELSRALGK